MAETSVLKKKKHIDWKEKCFYVSVVALPFLNFIFLVFIQRYVYTILFSFQTYDLDSASFVFQKDIFYNYRVFLSEFLREPGWIAAIKNSLMLYGLSWLFTPLGFIVPYYIFKKFPGSKFYKFMLVFPSMISSMVWVLIYKLLVDRMLPFALGWPMGLLSNIDTQMFALIVYGQWLGVGGSMLLFTGIMSGIDNSLFDAGKIDGMGMGREIWHICLPALYPVWSVGVIGGFVGIFNGSPSTFEFFGENADSNVTTVGYLMFTRVMYGESQNDLAFNAAGATMFMLVLLPPTLILKWALEHYGPSEDPQESLKEYLMKYFGRKWKNAQNRVA